MRRALKASATVVLLVVAAGCTTPEIIPAVNPQIEVVEEDQGWVEVRVSDVSETGYLIYWGDDDATSYGVSTVAPWQEAYAHFYQPVFGEKSGAQIPTEYSITLLDGEGTVIDQTSVVVETSNCHLEVVSIRDREVRLQYWGRFGIQYSISWGDSFADHVIVSTQSASGYAQHTYAAPGTYTVGMEEIWAPRQTFLTIEVE